MDEMYDFITDLPSGTDGFETDFDAAFAELRAVANLIDTKNVTLTINDLQKMDGLPVWVELDDNVGFYSLVEVCDGFVTMTNSLGGRTEYASDVEFEDDGIVAVYLQKPKTS